MPKAKVRKFKCSKCDRTFTMAAHLARHQNTVHGAKPKKKTARKKLRRRPAAKRPARKLARRAAKRPARKPAGRAAQRAPRRQKAPLLLQMQKYRSDLLQQRAHVESQIDAIDKALAAMGSTVRAPARGHRGGRRGGRTRAGSLKSHIEHVLRTGGRAMAVKDITTGVLKAGFKTKNKTLAKSVGLALAQMPNVRKVSRGMFRCK
jgi:hypothetical protein